MFLSNDSLMDIHSPRAGTGKQLYLCHDRTSSMKLNFHLKGGIFNDIYEGQTSCKPLTAQIND